MRLVALQPVKYRGIMHAIGDEFEAEDLHAKMFIGRGQARVKPRDLKAEEVATETSAEPKRGRYKRRDMVAEED